MDAPQFQLTLMFEWGGGCLWCLNENAYKAFGVGPVEQNLNLSRETLEQMQKLTNLHDTALNWEYPPDPGPWKKAEYDAFDIAALELLQDLKTQLGSDFRVFYDKLGYFEAD